MLGDHRLARVKRRDRVLLLPRQSGQRIELSCYSLDLFLSSAPVREGRYIVWKSKPSPPYELASSLLCSSQVAVDDYDSVR
jgi:hypothetical protein